MNTKILWMGALNVPFWEMAGELHLVPSMLLVMIALAITYKPTH